MSKKFLKAQSAAMSIAWRFAICLSIVIFASLAAVAQDTPRIQAFGGYSYLRFDTPSIGATGSTGLQGYNASVAGNITREFGIKAELSGQYGSHLNLRDLVVGPQVLLPHGRLLFYGHAMFGRARTFVNQGAGVGDTGNAVVIGGGVDANWLNHFAIRIIQADYVHTSLLSQDQNNFRFSTGVVFHMGGLSRRKRRPPTTQP